MISDPVNHRSTARQAALACAWAGYLAGFCAWVLWMVVLAGASLGELPLFCTAAVIAFVVAGVSLLAVDAIRRREPRFGAYLAPVAPASSL